VGKAYQSDRVNEETNSGALHANGYNCCGFTVNGARLQAAAELLGADYNASDHAVIARVRTHCFLATLHWNSAWSNGRRDCADLFWAADAGIWHQRVPIGIILRGPSGGSKRV
jgi:hypothetical protein